MPVAGFQRRWTRGDRGAPGMPIAYEIDQDRRLVVCTITGYCTRDEVLEFHARIRKDDRFDPSFSQLADGTGITGTDVTPSKMRGLAEKSPFSFNSRRAFVAHSQLGFGLWRVYEIVRTLKGDRYVRVFKSRTEALAWLLDVRQAA